MRSLSSLLSTSGMEAAMVIKDMLSNWSIYEMVQVGPPRVSTTISEPTQ